MEINNPAVLEELARLHSTYERALVDNDVETLEAMFWASPHAVRYGATENLYGIDEIRAFRRSRPKMNLDRDIQRKELLAFGDSVGVINLHFTRSIDGVMREGRQSQVWIRMEAGWRIASAHVSLIPQKLSYQDALSEMISLPVSADYRPAVDEECRRIAGVAQILMQFPLDQSIEAAPVFEP